MSRISEHVDVQQLRYVVVTGKGIFLLESSPDGCGLLLYEGSLISQRLAEIISSDVAFRQRHIEIRKYSSMHASLTLQDRMALMRAILG